MTRASQVRVRVPRGDFALDVDLAWDERVVVVFGPSGAGKSTFFDAVLGVHASTRPTVRIGGVTLDDGETGRTTPIPARGLGWVPQDALLFPHLTVERNLRYGSPRAGEARETHLRAAIDVLELGGLLDRRVDAISGGERQRVAIGRALASGPRALLLDEPLASLDLPLRARVLPYLLRVRDALDLPMLYITHDPDEAMLVGERVFVLDGGRLVAEGEPAPVLWSRAVLPLSESLGIENVLEARVVAVADGAATVRTAGGMELSAPAPAGVLPGQSLRLGLRAQDILIAADPPGRISARNVLSARIVALEDGASGILVHLDAGEPLVAKITRAARDALSLSPEARVHLVVKSQALRRLA